MYEYLECNALISETQHGFRRGRSCLTLLLKHHNEILENLIEGHDTDAIYLDYAKAFDRVDHDILIEKLRLYKFPDKLIRWLESFLRDRKQTVVVNGKQSYSASVISGVPQGTVLGPMLFIIFINDLSSTPLNSTIETFADDTKIIKRIENPTHMHELQRSLNSIMEWSSINNMRLNEDKFQLIRHNYSSSDQFLQIPPFNSNNLSYSTTEGKDLLPQSTVNDLGVLISENLSWSKHIGKIVSDSRRMAAWVLNTFHTRSPYVMLTLFKSLVWSKLEYCSPVWSSGKLCDLRALEGVQRSFTSSIAGMSGLN